MNSFILLWCKNRILNRKKLISCLILVSLVVTALVCALIFSNSMMTGISKKYIALSTGHILINNFVEDQFKINNNYIQSIDTVNSGFVLMYSSSGTCSLNVKGVSDSYFNDYRKEQLNISKIENDTNLHGVLISKATAETLNVKPGDKLALLVVPDSENSVLRPTMVFIEGIFTTGYDSMDKLFCYTDFDYSKLLFPDSKSLSKEIILKDEYVDLLNSIAIDIYNGNECSVNTWENLNYEVYQNFISSKQMIFIVLVVVSLVATFYVSSVSQQILSDDLKELAMLKLLGSNNQIIRKAEFYSVYLVTLAGIIVGFFFGVFVSYMFSPILKLVSKLSISSLSYYLLDFEIEIPFGSVLSILLILSFISFATIRFVLRKIKNITPVQLFNEQ